MIADTGRIVVKSGNVVPNFSATPEAVLALVRFPVSLTPSACMASRMTITSTPYSANRLPPNIPVDGRDYAPYPLSDAPGASSQFSSLGQCARDE